MKLLDFGLARIADDPATSSEFVAIRPENVQSAEIRLGVVTGWTTALGRAPRK